METILKMVEVKIVFDFLLQIRYLFAFSKMWNIVASSRFFLQRGTRVPSLRGQKNRALASVGT